MPFCTVVLHLAFVFRFPLFGGWQTRYYIGYNIPSYEYLYNSGNKFLLKMRFVDHIFDDQVIDEVTTRIILPEGCRLVSVRVVMDHGLAMLVGM